MSPADDTVRTAPQATDQSPGGPPAPPAATPPAAPPPGGATAATTQTGNTAGTAQAGDPAGTAQAGSAQAGKAADDEWVAGFPDAPPSEKKSRKGLVAIIALAVVVLIVGGITAGYLHHRAGIAADAHTTVQTPAHAGGLTKLDHNSTASTLQQQMASADVFAHSIGAAYRKPGAKTLVMVWGGELAKAQPGSILDDSDFFDSGVMGRWGDLHRVDSPDSIGGEMECADQMNGGAQGGATAFCMWGNHKAAVAFMAAGSGDQLAATAAAMLPDLVHRA